MLAAELIERKRDGEELTAEELGEFLAGYMTGDVAVQRRVVGYKIRPFSDSPEIVFRALRATLEDQTGLKVRLVMQSDSRGIRADYKLGAVSD